MGLLDDITKGHSTKRGALDAKLEAQKQEAAERKAAAEAAVAERDAKFAKAEAGVQRGYRPWIGDPHYSVAGLHEGGTFEFRNVGPDLEGKYVVVRLEVTRNKAQGEPRLWAARDDGQPPRPPYIEMYESAVREEIALERIKVISAIPKDKIVEAEAMGQRDTDALELNQDGRNSHLDTRDPSGQQSVAANSSPTFAVAHRVPAPAAAAAPVPARPSSFNESKPIAVPEPVKPAPLRPTTFTPPPKPGAQKSSILRPFDD